MIWFHPRLQRALSRLFPQRHPRGTRSCVRLLQQNQGKNSASLLQDRNATVARPCRSTDGLERRRCVLAGKGQKQKSDWHAPRGMAAARLVKGVGRVQDGLAKRGSPSKPITCKIVLPFWKSESWARRGQLVALQVYSLLLLCAPLLVFYTRAR